MIETEDRVAPGAATAPVPAPPGERPAPEIDPSPAPVELRFEPPITVPGPTPPSPIIARA